MDADQDLHIATHIEPATLPAMIRPVMALANTEAERDILLLSLITAAGSCMPHLYFRYGLTGKRYYPNLQCFIVGSAACGKGIANLALDFVRRVHAAVPLLIPGDSTYPAFYRQLERQDGRGYIHESEGSVITDVWRSAVTNYNTALRKAAEHEPITRNRVRDNSSIACPQLSVLLTGTFSQYRALVPSVENGYFSRLLTLVVDDREAFHHRYVQPADGAGAVMTAAAARLHALCGALFRSHPVEFSLTPHQRDRLGQHLENAYPALISFLGEDFHSVVLRMAVHIERMAMILTAMRLGENADDADMPSSVSPESYSGPLLCSDVDYATAELIGNKLILHMAAAYRMIHGAEPVDVPKLQPIDQRSMLLSLLPAEFESKLLIKEAQAQGIPQSTVLRWCNQWIEQGLVFRPSFGHYKKIA